MFINLSSDFSGVIANNICLKHHQHIPDNRSPIPLEAKTWVSFCQSVFKADDPSDSVWVTKDLRHRGEHRPAQVIHTWAVARQSIAPPSDSCAEEGIPIPNAL